MKTKYIIKSICFLFLVFLSSCNKNLDLEIVEVRCLDLRISEPEYEFIDSPCGDEIGQRAFEIQFQYDGDEECIFLVELEANFFDINGNKINTIIGDTTSLLTSGPFVDVTSSTVTFRYCYEFTDLADTNRLTYLQVDFHTENEIENESNELGVRLNIPGAPVLIPDPPAQTLEVNSKNTIINVRDDAAQDGDVISIYVNGTWIIENKTITNAGENISLPLQLGENFVLFYAVNEGDSPPNTLAAIVDDGFVTQDFDLSMSKGETQAIKITCL